MYISGYLECSEYQHRRHSMLCYMNRCAKRRYCFNRLSYEESRRLKVLDAAVLMYGKQLTLLNVTFESKEE